MSGDIIEIRRILTLGISIKALDMDWGGIIGIIM